MPTGVPLSRSGYSTVVTGSSLGRSSHEKGADEGKESNAGWRSNAVHDVCLSVWRALGRQRTLMVLPMVIVSTFYACFPGVGKLAFLSLLWNFSVNPLLGKVPFAMVM